MREVSIANRHPRLRFKRQTVVQVIALLDANPSVLGRQPRSIPPGELSLVFLTDAALAKLHGDFLGDPTSTDVITFEGDYAMGSAGEICVSADTAARYARERRGNFSRELTLYVVHGWLHLAGFDDLVPEKKRTMRRAEARAMRLLEHRHAIPEFSLVSSKRVASR
jgi:probable rRNA maturation factor